MADRETPVASGSPCRFRARCYRCDAILDSPSLATCPGCGADNTTRRSLLALVRRLGRFRLRTLLVLIALVAIAAGWAVHERRRRLADDRDAFFSHEEWAATLAFQESAARSVEREAEQKAAESGPDAAQWTAEARAARLQASEAGKARKQYEWRASLKRSW